MRYAHKLLIYCLLHSYSINTTIWNHFQAYQNRWNCKQTYSICSSISFDSDWVPTTRTNGKKLFRITRYDRGITKFNENDILIYVPSIRHYYFTWYRWKWMVLTELNCIELEMMQWFNMKKKTHRMACMEYTAAFTFLFQFVWRLFIAGCII